MTILERELSNSDLIYIYWEQDGKWYAYEQSAFYLSQMMLRVSLGPHRIVASAGYRLEYAKRFASSLSFIYEGMNMGYAGGYGLSLIHI